MDGSFGGYFSPLLHPPGASFGIVPEHPRQPEAGMGTAIARRTVFRPEDGACFGRVADRVAVGNMALLGRALSDAEQAERSRLRNAIASGALITSGRHLQHGDATQPQRNMEVFTNCATAITSFAKFYLLLNGSGVGRSYDDALIAVDWAEAPALQLHLDPRHPDYPHGGPALIRFAAGLGQVPWDTAWEALDPARQAGLRWWADELLGPCRSPGQPGVVWHRIEDSREGWAKAVEILESMAFTGRRADTLALDFSAIRRCGAPIRGMQGRPASGPLSLVRAFVNIREHVIEPARHRNRDDTALQPWEQAMLVDHYLSVEVQVGGARRAARMATKSWRDPGIFRFIRAKSDGGLWTANNSVMVDSGFWDSLRLFPGTADGHHARVVFEEATLRAYFNGEPGFINGDLLDDHRTGRAWQKPVYTDGRDFQSGRYRVDHGAAMLGALSARAMQAPFPATTNPCGEIVLHVTGGYCVIADFAPLLACPTEPEALVPGCVPDEIARLWDARVEDSVRLGVRFLLRVNAMDALYAEEVRRTNRMGIGPTGLHEWAWARYGLDFEDLLDEDRSAPFWQMLAHLSAVAKAEAASYAALLGTGIPFTVTTVKPAGTTSKLFGLTEGAHLPARRQYLRWVQFKGTRDADGAWAPDSDPLLADYEAKGYPVRALASFPGMSIVGFPTLPRIQRLSIGERLTTAPEADPARQYAWLRLLERHWIGREQGNQVSYTLKIDTDRHDLPAFREIVLANQPTVRCCAVLPSRPDRALGYEYLPEEEIPLDAFTALVAGIRDQDLQEAVDLAQLGCATGACPI